MTSTQKIKLSEFSRIVKIFSDAHPGFVLASIGTAHISDDWYWNIKAKDKYGVEHDLRIPMYEESFKED